ncbi:molybdopterin-dependent oxidoreductase [Marmoricola sp. URHB0036]|uniref:molybdopterin-dependent oxidoreductase n=1 Tax=Marmoricola sp. URHB0036 TaxID=1298863 RepID=UPI000420FE8C|nr:molybdopterin-dependent oxidoreductase [Marmoricola sp. URHB0036]
MGTNSATAHTADNTSSAAALSRRTVLGLAAVGAGAAATRPGAASAETPPDGPILKPLPEKDFVVYGSNAEMRWDSVDHDRFLTPQPRLFVRNDTSTPRIDPHSYRLEVFGDGLRQERSRDEAVSLSLAGLKRLPHTRITTVHECTGNGRSFYGTQQGTPAAGTQWKLGAVGTVTWEGVRLREVLRRLGIAPDAVDVMATGLDPSYVDKGTDYGPVRRPIPVGKALDDVLLAWAANGRRLLPDHGFPLRLVVPGWVGIASIKWLGSLEVSRSPLTSPWNTKWYRMTGGDWPADSPPLTTNPVRSAWELVEGESLSRRGGRVLHGRSWSGAGRIKHVEVSVDGDTWHRVRLEDHRDGWARWSYRWPGATAGDHALLARATDVRGRTQPDVARFNDGGYFFDAVVRHPVVIV